MPRAENPHARGVRGKDELRTGKPSVLDAPAVPGLAWIRHEPYIERGAHVPRNHVNAGDNLPFGGQLIPDGFWRAAPVRVARPGWRCRAMAWRVTRTVGGHRFRRPRLADPTRPLSHTYLARDQIQVAPKAAILRTADDALGIQMRPPIEVILPRVPDLAVSSSLECGDGLVSCRELQFYKHRDRSDTSRTDPPIDRAGHVGGAKEPVSRHVSVAPRRFVFVKEYQEFVGVVSRRPFVADAV